ncbi:MAG: hypothetical protein FRX48_09612 [Lasallia pustulata]|uniref:Uncharacterized protein n=1 Tax=Lasallia pustulata TaxID=136370 RepID=A0A5M8PBA7_9LECA|nr:MAG: hypothetical protein FRX48_09612 [Lasallia pustulata]
MIWLRGYESMKNRSSLIKNRRQTRKLRLNLRLPIFSFSGLESCRTQNPDDPKATTRSKGLRSDESYKSVNRTPPVHSISSYFRYPKSGKRWSTNQGASKAVIIPTSI